jgi:oligopeptide transport system substrate-binding protein
LYSVGLKSYFLLLLPFLAACGEGPWNDPHPPQPDNKVVYHSVMSPAPPKHLDPAISYSADESLFHMQIYEPPLGYHFLKRPYELVPLGVSDFPALTFLDAVGREVSVDSDELAFTRYTLHVREDARYQPHPAFAADDAGTPVYLFDDAAQTAGYRRIADFTETGSRPVTANDYVYGIKRLADPDLGSPMLGLMSKYIVGLQAFSQVLGQQQRDDWLNLDDFDMQGLKVVDERTFSITINGRYPQFKFWLAMHFFAPVPMEADRFYHNPGFAQRNLTMDWWPIGSGPFMMVKNDPNSEIVLERNPNFREEYFPDEGAPGDAEAGFLADAGKRLPFIDRAVFRLEKEVLPLWSKFLQGYYDRSGEGHSHTTGFFDQAFVVGPDGLEMSDDISDRGITMSPDVKPAVYYYGFNMRDPVLGGYTEERRKLRQALQIAFDVDEYLAIFYKGNGVTGHSLIPPGIPGHLSGEAGINPYVYDWVDGAPQRKSIEYAKQLLAEAGYPNGRDARTGEPLKIFIDVQSQATSNTLMNWMERGFAPLGVQVEFRPADWNRTREKLITGNTQIYSYGWLADYPDPENFLFLLNGPESPLVCDCDGSNNSNYESAEYDALFTQMRVLPLGPERAELVARMVELYRRDAVWLYSFFPKEIYLNNSWVHNTKRHGITKGTLKYVRLEPEVRRQNQLAWNQPTIWPLYAGGLLLAMVLLPGVNAYRRRQNATAR